MTSNIEIKPASVEHQSVIAQLYELYTYEMTYQGHDGLLVYKFKSVIES